jgi:MoaA/NifB/PqqE/SkfB family radical SAM enzyme
MAGLGTIASRLVPAVCDISVTNICNATCDFSAYAYDKQLVKDRYWIDRRQLAEASPILRRRGIRYVNFQGGEPLRHREIEGLVADARGAGMTPALITNRPACGRRPPDAARVDRQPRHRGT